MNARIILPVLVAVAVSGCAASGGVSTAEIVGAPATQWLRENARQVAADGDDFADLEFLRPLVEGKRVVQLGQNAHGAREINQLRVRMIRYLHEELGFDVVVFESPLYECYAADLQAGTAPAVETMTGCTYPMWHSRELLPLFEYIRETRNTERPLRVAGMDIEPVGGRSLERPRFLSSAAADIDRGYAAEVFSLDSTFLDVFGRVLRHRRAWFRSENGPRMTSAYDSLTARLAVALNGGESSAEALVARQTAWSVAQHVRQELTSGTKPYIELRDSTMAENLFFLLEELYPGSRAVVWTDNLHARRDNMSIPVDRFTYPDVPTRTMGTWVHERYGDEAYTVGIYANRGRVAANTGSIYELIPPEPRSIEAMLSGLGAGNWFVDLSRAPAGPETAWMDTVLPGRQHGVKPLMLIPRRQYDALVVIGHVTPRERVY